MYFIIVVSDVNIYIYIYIYTYIYAVTQRDGFHKVQARRLIFQFIPTRLHGVMSQRMIILTLNAVVISDLILCKVA